MKLRIANFKKQQFLWGAQYHAALLDSKDELMVAVCSNRILASYVEGWGGAGDMGVIAEHETSQWEPLGAGYFRKI